MNEIQEMPNNIPPRFPDRENIDRFIAELNGEDGGVYTDDEDNERIPNRNRTEKEEVVYCHPPLLTHLL